MQTEGIQEHKIEPLTPRALFFFRMLLNKYYSGKVDQLEKLLPKEEYESLAKCNCSLKSPNALFFNAKEWLGFCDPTWIEPAIKTLPKSLQEIYGAILKKDGSQKQLSEPLEQFLLQYLHHKWHALGQKDDILPKELVPACDLSVLLELKKKELMEIVDLLSMHDLIDEVRHIVDKRVLQTLSQLLTSNQQQYLRSCLRQKTKPAAPSFTLRTLLQDPKSFAKEIHKQGLKRLALALHGENKDLIWYILHAFDVTRAKFIDREIQPAAIPHATKLAQLEILQILQFLKSGMKS